MATRPRSRSKDVQVNLEPMLFHKVMDVAPRTDERTASSFLRRLIIDELRKMGELTDQELVEMARAC